MKLKQTSGHAWAAAIALSMSACVTTPESYLAAHPETPPSIAAGMRERTVVPGMTRAQVRVIWGMPASKAGWSGGDSWTFTNFDANGNLKSPQAKAFYEPGAKDQAPANPFAITNDGVRKMVYFRGDQVVLVEKSGGF